MVIDLLKTIKALIGNERKLLIFPIFLMILDCFGSIILYFMLYMTVIHLLEASLTLQIVLVYTAICLLGVIYRILVYRKSYLTCFTRAFEVSKQMRIRFADHVRNLSLGYFNKNSSGYLLNTMTNDMGSFEGVLSHALSFFIKTLTLCTLMLIGTFFINWKLALAECIVLIIAYPLLHWGNCLVQTLGAKKRTLTSRMVSIVMEYLQGMKVFKSHNMTNTHFSRMLYTLEKIRRLSIHTECKMALPTSLYSIVVNFLMPLMLLLGSYLLLGGSISPDSLIAFLIMSTALSTLLISFEHYYNMLKDLKLAAQNLQNVLEYQPLPFDLDEVKFDNFDVKFHQVCFSYESGTQVLHNISFVAPSGSTTALIGASGSGKSTIASLIARFWDVTSGSIEIGNTNIQHVNPEELLQYVSAVFQDNTLLSDTIQNNIKIGNPSASMDDIISVAKIAHCHEFIMELPDGYQTYLSEGGNSLSGGEKQRIAIARALLKDAPILLLDESTASLDADNEQKINQALDKLMENKTVFVIAHRLNTIKHADQIILLDNGRIEECGTHDFLMKIKGHYYRMIQEQEKAKHWIVKGV